MMANRFNGTANASRLLWIGGLLVIIFFLLLTIDAQMSRVRGGDGPSYLLLAESIAGHYAYADINAPGAPPHTQYPPLFPLLLAPVYFGWGYNFLLMKFLLLAFNIGSVFAVRKFFAKESGDGLYATLIAVLTGTNFYFLFYTNEILTEVPYTLISFMVLIYWQKHSDGRLGTPQFLTVLPLLLAMAYMTRMIGVTLLAAASVSVLLSEWQKKGPAAALRKAFLFGAVASIPFALWTIRSSIYADGVATYQSIFAQADYYSLDSGSAGLSALFERFTTNCGYYYDGIYKTVVTFKSAKEGLPGAVFLIIFLLVMAGFLKELFSKREMKDFYFLFYMGLLTVWPVYGSGDARRYLVPLIPLIYHYLFEGAALAARPLHGIVGRTGKAALVLPSVFLLLNGVEIGDKAMNIKGGFEALSRAHEGRIFEKVSRPVLADIGVGRFRESAPCYFDYLHAIDLMNGRVSENDVLTARKPEIVYLMTGKPVVRFPYTKDLGLMEKFMLDKGVTHLLIDSCYGETEDFLRPFVLSRPEGFILMLSDNKGTALLKVQ